MKRFLAIFLGSDEANAAWNALPEATRNERVAAGMQAWGQWVARHRDAILDPGAPLGRTKSISAAGIADTRNALGAYCIVQAASHEEAARLFEGHPHFTLFAGVAVEVMECLPIPDAPGA